MASQREQLGRENTYLKGSKPLTKSVSNVTRPALGEVGNKIHLHQTQNEKQNKVKAHPPGILQKGVIGVSKKPTNVIIAANKKSKTVSNSDKIKETRNCEKKVIQEKDTFKLPKFESIEEPFSYSSNQLLSVINIDISENPVHVSEYVQDIYGYLLELENQHHIKKNFLDGHKTTPRMRAILINWMVEVHISLNILLETLHLSVSICDRYLQLNKTVDRKILQLVGATALWIASKYEEVFLCDLSEFVYLCDNTFTKKQFLEMEGEILKRLDFQLGRPLSLQFLRRFSKIAEVKAIHHTLGKYLIELALIEYDLCYIKPSILAAAACCLSRTLLDNLIDPSQAWTTTLVYYSSYKYTDIKSVIMLLARALQKIETSKHKFIYTKYSSAVHSQISLNKVLKSPIIQKLACLSSNMNTK